MPSPRQSSATSEEDRGAAPIPSQIRDALRARDRSRRGRAEAPRDRASHQMRVAEPGVRKRANLDSGRVAPSRTAAIGGTRVARTAGRKLATSVTRMPTRSDKTIVRVSSRSPWFGSVKPTVSKSLKRHFASRRPKTEPDHRRERADDERLEHDRAEHLTPRAAERPDRRELAGSLSDRDRERVRDHEAADEERDAGEDEQEDPEEADELFGVRRVLLRLLGRRA